MIAGDGAARTILGSLPVAITLVDGIERVEHLRIKAQVDAKQPEFLLGDVVVCSGNSTAASILDGANYILRRRNVPRLGKGPA